MTIGRAPMCMFCTRYRKELTCDAFPDGIPEPIIVWEADHRQPYEGDHGIQFEAIDADADAYVGMRWSEERAAAAADAAKGEPDMLVEASNRAVERR